MLFLHVTLRGARVSLKRTLCINLYFLFLYISHLDISLPSSHLDISLPLSYLFGTVLTGAWPLSEFFSNHLFLCQHSLILDFQISYTSLYLYLSIAAFLSVLIFLHHFSFHSFSSFHHLTLPIFFSLSLSLYLYYILPSSFSHSLSLQLSIYLHIPFSLSLPLITLTFILSCIWVHKSFLYIFEASSRFSFIRSSPYIIFLIPLNL